VVDSALPRDERLAAYNSRSDWDRTLGVGKPTQLANMVTHFDHQGIVEVRPGVPDDPDFAPVMQVEDRGGQDLTPQERHETDRAMRQVLIRQSNKR
jgi:hypothetical protein